MKLMDRNTSCPICAGNRFDLVHRQDFILPGDVRTHYVVVSCAGCGFAFARDLPTAEEYESYYRTNLRYTYEGSRGAADALFAIHQGSFELVDRHLSHAKERHILDIGCSTGELLALFQRAGYARLTGVDPTPECSEIAKRLHGVDVTTAVLSEISAEQPYDVVLLANVLEHIPNLRQAMQRVGSVLRSDGLLFVQVPDAAHFGADFREPFLEFSIEHVNFFTETSLANLLDEFSAVEVRHEVVAHKGVSYPVITSLWRKSGAGQPRMVSDTSALRTYVERSNARLEELRRTIDELVAGGEPLVIWGVGSLTARFLATTNLAKANIAGFVDSNSGHHGKRLLDREIAPPSSLAGRDVTVFVSSFVYGAEIRRTLESDLGYRGRIVTIGTHE
jgi:SAM-dependent methyltransferase